MRLIPIDSKQVYKEVERYFKKKIRISRKGGRKVVGKGRPRKYSDGFIITLVFLQEYHGFSVREVLWYARKYFKDVPVESSYQYRKKRLTTTLVEDVIEYLSKRIIEILEKKRGKGKGGRAKYMIIDGTGFGYNDLYPMKFERGTQVRSIKSHVRAVVVIGDFGKVGSRRIKTIMGIKAGKAYSSEVKLAREIVAKWEKEQSPPGEVLIGDPLYATIDLIQRLQDLGIEPHIKVREDTFRSKIRNPLLLQMRQRVKKGHYYRHRSEIEGFFSEVKQKLTSMIRTKDPHIAQISMLARFACFNLYMLMYVQFLPGDHFIIFVCFFFYLPSSFLLLY